MDTKMDGRTQSWPYGKFQHCISASMIMDSFGFYKARLRLAALCIRIT